MNLASIKLLFDLNGFVHLRNVFTHVEVEAANKAINTCAVGLERKGALRNTKTNSSLSGDEVHTRIDIGGMLEWPSPHSEVFRSVLAHPTLIPVLHELIGKGYRLDHQPLVIKSQRGAEGFTLHGGPVVSNNDRPGDAGVPNQYLTYKCENGVIQNSLIAVAVQLSDHNAGDGGFCVVRGSHKMKFPLPDHLKTFDKDSPELDRGLGRANGSTATEFLRDYVEQPVTRKGDVIIFSEATVHGSLPWNSDNERRVALYRFAPSNFGYGRGYVMKDPSLLQDFTEPQKAVLLPPFNNRLERPELYVDDETGEVVCSVTERAQMKKDHDMSLFGVPYF